jgi:hypothetical protein
MGMNQEQPSKKGRFWAGSSVHPQVTALPKGGTAPWRFGLGGALKIASNISFCTARSSSRAVRVYLSIVNFALLP